MSLRLLSLQISSYNSLGSSLYDVLSDGLQLSGVVRLNRQMLWLSSIVDATLTPSSV
jgi:hypothetical protein